MAPGRRLSRLGRDVVCPTVVLIAAALLRLQRSAMSGTGQDPKPGW